MKKLTETEAREVVWKNAHQVKESTNGNIHAALEVVWKSAQDNLEWEKRRRNPNQNWIDYYSSVSKAAKELTNNETKPGP